MCCGVWGSVQLYSVTALLLPSSVWAAQYSHDAHQYRPIAAVVWTTVWERRPWSSPEGHQFSFCHSPVSSVLYCVWSLCFCGVFCCVSLLFSCAPQQQDFLSTPDFLCSLLVCFRSTPALHHLNKPSPVPRVLPAYQLLRCCMCFSSPSVPSNQRGFLLQLFSFNDSKLICYSAQWSRSPLQTWACHTVLFCLCCWPYMSRFFTGPFVVSKP